MSAREDLVGLVARLRDCACGGSVNVYAKAADAIETLAAENARLSASEPKCAVIAAALDDFRSVVCLSAVNAAKIIGSRGDERGANALVTFCQSVELFDLSMMVPDASAALNRVKAEAEAQGMRKAAQICEDERHKRSAKGADQLSTNGLWTAHKRILAAIPEGAK